MIEILYEQMINDFRKHIVICGEDGIFLGSSITLEDVFDDFITNLPTEFINKVAIEVKKRKKDLLSTIIEKTRIELEENGIYLEPYYDYVIKFDSVMDDFDFDTSYEDNPIEINEEDMPDFLVGSMW